MAKHYLIFIHGIGELKEDETMPANYETLWQLLIHQSNLSEQEFNQKFGRIDVDWHIVPLKRAAKTIFDHELAFANPEPQGWNLMGAIGQLIAFLSGNAPARLMRSMREFMTFSLGDAIAYVSEDVNLIRRAVWRQIWNYSDQVTDPVTGQASHCSFKQLLEAGATYSIVAHSLGTTIAFDYLFELFEQGRLFVPSSDPNAQSGERISLPNHDQDIKLLQEQFRHFFSMGSPIGLFLLRKGALWMNKTPFATLRNPIRGKGRVWCNFGDSNDVIAYPLQQLFENDANLECKLLDIPVETGWIVRAHLRYWKNEKVAKEIGRWILADN